MSVEVQISEELDQLAISSLNNSLEIVSAGEELWPLAILSTGEDFEIQQFSDDAPEECYQAAREYVAAAGADVTAYAICLDGHAELEFEGCSADGVETQISDAVIIEFAERGDDVFYSMITPYREASSPGGFEILSDTALVIEEGNLLS